MMRHIPERRAWLAVSLISLWWHTACVGKQDNVETSQLQDFAARYTAAWCSQDAASLAAFFAEQGSLQINGGRPRSGAQP
jgi:hypothetical protein